MQVGREKIAKDRIINVLKMKDKWIKNKPTKRNSRTNELTINIMTLKTIVF
jgi:hypothetical protein